MTGKLQLAALLSLLAAVPLLAQPGPDGGRGGDPERALAMIAGIGFSASPEFSPGGGRVAFVSDVSGLPQLWIVPLENGWPARLTKLDDPVGVFRWSPAGNWLAFTLSPGGGMNRQIYLLHPDGAGLRRITAGRKRTNRLGVWGPNGRLLTLASNRRTARSLDVYTYEVRRHRFRLLARNPGIGSIRSISRDAKWAVLRRVENRGDNNLYLVNLRTRKEVLLTPHRPPDNFSGPLFSPDGRTIYLTSDQGRDLAGLARIKLDAGHRPGPVELIAVRDDAALDQFAATSDGRTAALLWNVAGRSELSFVNLDTGQLTSGPQLGVRTARDPVFSSDGRLLAMTISGPAEPADIWIFDRQTGELRQLTHIPLAGVDPASLVSAELVRFHSYDALELTGWLYRGRGAKQPGAVVLSFHGGPEGQARPEFRADYQALLSHGISVFAPNIRGSGGFGKRFAGLDNGPARLNAIQDIKACVEYLVRIGVADPKRVGIMGRGYGGYLALAGLSKYPKLFAAGADWNGIVDLEKFFQDAEPWLAAISKVEYGNPVTQSDMLRELSPIHKINRVTAPTIILHGANNSVVPAAEAGQVAEALKAHGVPVHYILFPNEGRRFEHRANHIRATVAVVHWFDRYLNQPGPRRAGSSSGKGEKLRQPD